MRKIESAGLKPEAPLRKVSHEKRLELARRIASRLVDTYKDAVLAVCIFLKEAARVGWDWPLGADQFRNRIVLFERHNWLKKLEEAVAQNDRADFTEELRWAVLTVTESLAAVRNARIKGDLRDLRTRAFYMAWDAARVVFLCNRKYVLTTSWFWKQLFECQEQPKDFRNLIDIVAGFTESTQTELVDATEKLWLETITMVRARGFSIESMDIIV